MDSDGDVLVSHEEDRTVEAFGRTAEKAKEVLALKARAAKGDPEAAYDYFLKQVDAGTIGLADARARAKAMKLTPDQQKQIDKRLFDLEVLDVRNGMRGPDDIPKAARAILAWVEQKKIPEGDSAFEFFWQILLNHGDSTKDAKVFQTGYDLLKDRFGDNPQYKRMIESIGKRLEELRKADAGGKGETKNEKK